MTLGQRERERFREKKWTEIQNRQKEQEIWIIRPCETRSIRENVFYTRAVSRRVALIICT